MYRARLKFIWIIVTSVILFTTIFAAVYIGIDNTDIKITQERNDFAKIKDDSSDIDFTAEEQTIIDESRSGTPITMGVIPHAFPLSNCPPESKDYTGLNIEILKLISEKSRLQFQLSRIPLEKMSPYDSLQAGNSELVLGSIKLQRYIEDEKIIMSNRVSDGAAACVSKSKVNIFGLKEGKVAMLKGYQAGIDFAATMFPDLEIVTYNDNATVVEEVRKGTVSVGIVSRYVAYYELQKPLNKKLSINQTYEQEIDSCIMGIRTPRTELIVGIINKTLAAISINELNHVEMNFTLENPYQYTFLDYIYEYSYIVIAIGVIVATLILLFYKLAGSNKKQQLLAIDSLTGAYTESKFNLEVDKMLSRGAANLFLVDFDIINFHNYNDINGRQAGDTLLRQIEKIVREDLSSRDVLSRIYGDNFKVLCAATSLDDLIARIQNTESIIYKKAMGNIKLCFGVYEINDCSVAVTKIFDFATQAKKEAKVSPENNIYIFNSMLYERSKQDKAIVSGFQQAIDDREFVVHYQPKFDAQTKKMSGAEALVRWQLSDGSLRYPNDFIELFERNGKIKTLDFYVLEQVAIYQRKIIDSGITPVIISVNFSQWHLYNKNFINELNALLNAYNIDKSLIEIEWTETAIANYDNNIIELLEEIRANGYSVAMDDFGKAYSSLNMLSNVPIDIIKLDRCFLMSEEHNIDKSTKLRAVVSQIVALAGSLSLKVVAEGVETEEQYQFLREVGCHYIQGYLFARPMSEENFTSKLMSRENNQE